MHLLENAMPEDIISYTKHLAGGEYGEQHTIYYGGNRIFFDTKSIPEGIETTSKKVCGYVSYVLQMGFTHFPGNSDKDSQVPKCITSETIQSFKNRIAYLMPKGEAASEGDSLSTKK